MRKSASFRYAQHLQNTSVNPTPIDVGRRYIRNIGTMMHATAIILLHLTSERVGINMQPGDDLHLRFSPSGKNAGWQYRRDIARIWPYEKRLALMQPPTVHWRLFITIRIFCYVHALILHMENDKYLILYKAILLIDLVETTSVVIIYADNIYNIAKVIRKEKNVELHRKIRRMHARGNK